MTRISSIAALLLMVATLPATAAEVVVRGLFDGAALLDVAGEQKLVRVGEHHPSGVKLLSANSHRAVVEIKGQRHQLSLNKGIGAIYREADKKEVVLQRNANREYRTRIYINGRGIDAVVDTGATSMALSSAHARHLGISYQGGAEIAVATASGVSQGYAVQLNKVSVGSIERHHVEAIVIEGSFPHVVLLGMTFLEHVDLSESGNILTMSTR